MPAIGIGLGVPFNRKRLGYPISGLQGKYIQLSEGGDLINTRGGISIPYVSGTGLDQLFDFSVLNDNRFDKGSYIGNAYGLPEYYNYPYVNIYYDATSATTRHYWKITDFHYANILAQSITLDNQFFLSAKATTNTSNVIASWSELLIYSAALIGDNLTKMKTYIGIQDDFTGNELLTNGNFDTDSDWEKGIGWLIVDGHAVYVGNGWTTCYQINKVVSGIIYYVSFEIDYLNNGGVGLRFGNGSEYGEIRNSIGIYNEIINVINTGYFGIYSYEVSDFKVNYASLKQFYQNYYAS